MSQDADHYVASTQPVLTTVALATPKAGKSAYSGYLLILLASFGWSMAGVFVTWIMAAGQVGGVTLAFWRDGGAMVCLLAALGLRRRSVLRIRWRDLGWLFAAGGLGIGVFHALWNLSIAANGVAVAGAITHTSAAFAAVGARILWREPLSRLKRWSLALAVTGAALVFGVDRLFQVRVTFGSLLVAFGAALAYSAYGLFCKGVSARLHPLTVTTWGFVFATLVLLPFQRWNSLPAMPAPSLWPSYAALVLVSTILAFTAYAAGLRQVSVSTASILSTSAVIFQQVWAYLLLGERLQPLQFAGVALVLGSVILLLRAAPTAAKEADLVPR
jgi:DME family drug/metabolite transporter